MAELNNINGEEYNIKYYNKNTFDLIIEAYDDDNEPISLDGKSFKMQIKKKKTDSTAVAELVSGTDITIGGDDNNRLTFNKYLDLEQRSYYYDLLNVTDKDTILYGKFIVIEAVTE